MNGIGFGRLGFLGAAGLAGALSMVVGVPRLSVPPIHNPVRHEYPPSRPVRDTFKPTGSKRVARRQKGRSRQV